MQDKSNLTRLLLLIEVSWYIWHSDIALINGAENFIYDEAIAISPIEMDLGLITTIIFEQLYRAYRIMSNQPYHLMILMILMILMMSDEAGTFRFFSYHHQSILTPFYYYLLIPL
jgi:hypothetical protein